MATHNTITVTITDAGSMSEATAGKIASEIQAYISKRYGNDDRVTSCTPILTTDTATITIT